MKRIALTLIVLLISLASAVAQEAQAQENPAFTEDLPRMEELFAQNSVNALEAELEAEQEGINRFFTSDEDPRHVPAVALGGDLLEAAYDIDFSVGVETVYLIPWEEVSPEKKALSIDEFSLDIYRILQNVSSLQGIEYYSASRERMRTLFAECWAINNPDDRTRISDPQPETIPSEDVVFIHQKDLTFGKNVSQVEYQHNNGHFRMGIVNLTTMTYMLFPIVGKENMSMQILVIPTQEGIVFYGLNTVKVLDLPIFYRKMESSFTNRMIALFHWFQARM